jgi:lauroyl/myristoyl acyltransferase
VTERISLVRSGGDSFVAVEELTKPPSVAIPRTDGKDVDPITRLRQPHSHLPRVEFRLEERHHFRRLLSITLAIVLSWAVRLMPKRLRYFLGDKGGDLSYRVSRAYRQSVTDNLRHVLGPNTSDRDLQAAVRNVFRVSGRNVGDILLVPHLSSEEIVDRLSLVSGKWSYLDDAFAAGRGVVIVTGHLGAFDFVGQVLHHRGYKLTSVTGRTTSRFLFDGITFLRRSHDMRLVEASPSGIRSVIRALQRGEGAAFLTDRDFFQNGKPVLFFGCETTLSPGAVRIARDTGAPIVPVFGVRTSDGHGLIIEQPFYVQKTSDVGADVARGLGQVVAVLERVIGSAPEQWVMFQRVWPEEPAGCHRGAPVDGSDETASREPGADNVPPFAPASPLDPPPKDRTATLPRSAP